MKILISASQAGTLTAEMYKVTKVAGDTPTFLVSVDATKMPEIAVIKDLALPYESKYYKKAETYSVSGIPLTVGGKPTHPSKLNSFKANKVKLVFNAKFTEEQALEQLNSWIATHVASQNAWIAKQAKRKAEAPERKKVAQKLSAEEQKARKEQLARQYGKGTADRVKIKQIGGDDGYQYNVIVDGRSIMNGLTRSSALHEQQKAIDALARKGNLGKYAK
jgi:hypothetical protein